MRLILLGPPGAGKGTQAKYLVQQYGLAHLSTGEILRQAVKDGKSFGKEISSLLDSGQLVPDDLINAVVSEQITSCLNGFILDGYPRTLYQAGFLKKNLNEKKIPLSAVIDLKVSDEILFQRILSRYICADCGRVYNNNSENFDFICKNCSSSSFHRRTDDTFDTIQRRLFLYYKETAPIVGYYYAQGLLFSVDGLLEEKEVNKKIREILETSNFK